MADGDLLPGLVAGVQPTGFLSLARPARHACQPPMNAETFPRPDAPRGVGPVVWRCTCRRLWFITETPLTRGQVLADRRVWRRAGWVMGWRYRNATALDPANP